MVTRSVSIDARSIRRDDNELIHVGRHRLAQLQAIAIVSDDERAWYDSARITRVRELPARTADEVIDIGGERIVRHGIGQVLAVR